MTITENRKARFELEILDTIECGIVLIGSELRPLREKKASINESFVKIKNDELWLINAQINANPFAKNFGHEERRDRKLLAKKTEVTRLRKQLDEKHLTSVPLKMYITDRGHVKVLIGIGRGKKLADKRETIKKRDTDRELKRQIKGVK